MVDQQHSALDPATAREHRVAAQRIGRCAAARGPLGMRHHRFELSSSPAAVQQTVRHQAVVWLSSTRSDLRRAGSCAFSSASEHRRAGDSGSAQALRPRTYPSPVSPVSYRSCNRRGPAGSFPRAGQLLPRSKGRTTTRLSRHQVDVDASPRQAGGRLARRVLPTVWTRRQVHLTTPSPHSALSRPRLTASTTIIHEKGNFTTSASRTSVPGNSSTERSNHVRIPRA